MELLQREWERGKMPSPIFACFGIFNHLFKCDWLHCADQGVTADFLGNFFAYLVLKKMPGNNIHDRSLALGGHLEIFYEENHVEDRLKEFLPKTFHSDRKNPGHPGSKAMLLPQEHLFHLAFSWQTNSWQMMSQWRQP